MRAWLSQNKTVRANQFLASGIASGQRTTVYFIFVIDFQDWIGLVRAYDQVDGRSIKRSFLLLTILFLAVIFFSEATLANGTPRRVLILHSYNYTFPANAAISDSLRKELGQFPDPIEIEAEFLDLARRPDEPHALRTANLLQEKYANARFDAVVVVGIPGMPFLLKYRDLIAPGVPVVWSDVTRATFDATKAPADITAVINDYKPERTSNSLSAFNRKQRGLYDWRDQ